jgi:HAD superfamily phosphatase (TIGR01668 family)
MSPLSPDRFYSSVAAIDMAELRQRGVRHLLVDLDNTLLPRDTAELSEEARAWVAQVREEGFSLCLVSNNWHERVNAVAADLGVDLVARALKPFPFAFRRGMRLLGATPATTAVVGDQVFTDILGGRIVGAFTVLVQPLSRSDLPHTLLLRLIERWVLADREPTA